MMGKHDEARVRVDRSLELALNNGLPMQAATAYRSLADLRDLKADYDGARNAHLHAISFCRQKGTLSEEHLCLGCLGYALFRTGQWRKAIENARKVLLDKDASSWPSSPNWKRLPRSPCTSIRGPCAQVSVEACRTTTRRP